MRSETISGSGLSLPTRTESEARAQRSRGFDPAIFDPSQDWYQDVTFTMSPSARQRRRARLARWLVGGMAALILSLLAMYAFTLLQDAL